MNKAIFLDRDGVILKNNPNYIRCPEEVFIPSQALLALQSLVSTDYKVVVVTNQPAISKGIITLEVADSINRWMLDIIKNNGGRIDKIYMCPHRDSDNCDCRKPKPGMILQASKDLDIDLKQSFMIGDAMSDIQSGIAAGILNNILVMTGRGLMQMELLDHKIYPNVRVFIDLQGAVNWILKE